VRRTPALLACAVTAGAMLLPASAHSAEVEHEAIDALNEVRRDSGLRPLRVSDDLNRSSGAYARRMLRLDFFGHGPSIDVAGAFQSAGETLAWHSGWNAQPRRTLSRWMGSPSHRAILMSPSYRWVGMGLARGKLHGRLATTWVAHVGTR
jgi:uncharacterized protein YkwD